MSRYQRNKMRYPRQHRPQIRRLVLENPEQLTPGRIAWIGVIMVVLGLCLSSFSVANAELPVYTNVSFTEGGIHGAGIQSSRVMLVSVEQGDGEHYILAGLDESVMLVFPEAGAHTAGCSEPNKKCTSSFADFDMDSMQVKAAVTHTVTVLVPGTDRSGPRLTQTITRVYHLENEAALSRGDRGENSAAVQLVHQTTLRAVWLGQSKAGHEASSIRPELVAFETGLDNGPEWINRLIEEG